MWSWIRDTGFLAALGFFVFTQERLTGLWPAMVFILLGVVGHSCAVCLCHYPHTQRLLWGHPSLCHFRHNLYEALGVKRTLPTQKQVLPLR